jgi:transcription initiation factor TFIIF subunit beta
MEQDGGDSQSYDPLFDDTVEDDKGDLSLENLDKKVWLVKVPRFLSDRWKHQAQEGQELGRIRIHST